jgi:hypothetical protein
LFFKQQAGIDAVRVVYLQQIVRDRAQRLDRGLAGA